MKMMTMIIDDHDYYELSHLVKVLLLLPLQQLHGIEESRQVMTVCHPPEVQLLLQHVHKKAETQDAHNQKAQVKDPHST